MATKKTVIMESQLDSIGVINNTTFNPAAKKIFKTEFDINKYLKDIDATQASGRFKWKGLPKNIYSFRLEQMLYNKGSLVFFEAGGEFFLLPFTACGGINYYGLPNKVKPLAYDGGASNKEFTNKELVVNYSMEFDKNANAVILFDRFNGLYQSNQVIPRSALQQTIIDEIVKRCMTLNYNLINSQGKQLIIVKDEKTREAVEKQLEELYNSKKSYGIMRSSLEVQVINNEIKYQEQEIWEDITSWNNLRLEGLGITNNGLFNKKERQLTGEISGAQEPTSLIIQNALDSRKMFIEQVRNQFKDQADKFKGLSVELAANEMEEQQAQEQDEKAKNEPQEATNE